ncbi:MAG: ABC transporter ATP-binding protein [Planctomycetota bacterium]
MSVALELTGVGYAFGDRRVLSDVSLSVSAGELVGLLGPNGAGKTTLLKIADGLLSGHAGRVRLGERPIRELKRTEVARRIGWVPQDIEAIFPYSVQEIVMMGRFAHLGPWDRESEDDQAIVDRSLEATDATMFKDRYLGELSGGERQRVFLARALAQEPEILLLDEPTSFLDLKHRLEIYRLLASLAKDHGLAVLAASHDLQLIARFCDRLVLLKEGKVAATGAPKDVLDSKVLSEVFETPVEVEWREGQPLLVWR